MLACFNTNLRELNYMAIVTCPMCSSKMSDKAPSCPSCGATSDMDDEQRHRVASRISQKKLQQISTHNMIAVIIALAGFYVMYFQSPDPESWQLKCSQGAVAIGFLWYIVNRIRHFMIKSALKKS